jgi:hypothetical protein
MSEPPIPDNELNEVLGGPADLRPIDRRKSQRFETRGTVEFRRPSEKTRHRGNLVDISEGGLCFVTTVPLLVGETLHLTYEEEGKPRSAEATVETVHSQPREIRVIVGAKYLK